MMNEFKSLKFNRLTFIILIKIRFAFFNKWGVLMKLMRMMKDFGL